MDGWSNKKKLEFSCAYLEQAAKLQKLGVGGLDLAHALHLWCKGHGYGDVMGKEPKTKKETIQMYGGSGEAMNMVTHIYHKSL